MNNQYLIPANSKKSQLKFGVFTAFDLALFLVGLAITIFLLIVLDTDAFWQVIIILLPALISAFLVMPIPNYHNMLTVIINIYNFLTTNEKLVWKGWCANGKEDK